MKDTVILNFFERMEAALQKAEALTQANTKLLRFTSLGKYYYTINDLVKRTGYTRGHFYNEITKGNLKPSIYQANDRETPLFDEHAVRAWLSSKKKDPEFIERVLL